jgi:hypothetical protein
MDALVAIITHVGQNKNVPQTCKSVLYVLHHAQIALEMKINFKLSTIHAEKSPRHISGFIDFFRNAKSFDVTIDFQNACETQLKRNQDLIAELESALERLSNIRTFSLKSEDFDKPNQPKLTPRILANTLLNSAKTLTHLSLTGQVFSAAETQALTNVLQHASSLTFLELRRNVAVAMHNMTCELLLSETWKLVLQLLEARKKSLETMCLSMIGFCDDELIEVFNILSVHDSTLKRIIFSGNVLSNNGFFEAPVPPNASPIFNDALFVDCYRVVVQPMHGAPLSP